MDNRSYTYLPIAVATESFVVALRELSHKIENLDNNRSVQSGYFEGDGTASGFLTDLIACLRDEGYHNMVSIVHPKLTEAKALPVMNFAEGISHLSSHQLQKLRRLHSDMESSNGKGEGYFAEKYRRLYPYFDTSHGSVQRSEAGRFIMSISYMSEKVIGLKELITYFREVITERFQKVMDELREELTPRVLEELDGAKAAIGKLFGCFMKMRFKMPEITSFTRKLEGMRKDFVKVVIAKYRNIKETSTNAFANARRSLETWLEWEILQKEDGELAEREVGDDFLNELVAFKKDLDAHVQVYEVLSKRMNALLEQKEYISHHFFEM
ncbi:MAG: hypothetical protein HQL31_13155, partial [Planctomycetes bacterium]|nr:hypothetical protein [Planctomycetota bacterium]